MWATRHMCQTFYVHLKKTPHKTERVFFRGFSTFSCFQSLFYCSISVLHISRVDGNMIMLWFNFSHLSVSLSDAVMTCWRASSPPSRSMWSWWGCLPSRGRSTSSSWNASRTPAAAAGSAWTHSKLSASAARSELSVCVRPDTGGPGWVH